MHGSGAQQGRSAAGGWVLAYPPLVRVAGVPAAAMEGLRHKRTAEAIDRLIGRDGRPNATREEIVRLREALDQEQELVLPRLRAALAAPEFRRALATSAPCLLVELERWLADERRRPRRRRLIQLVKYLAGASVKTGGYGMFTASGFGRWAEPARQSTELQEALGVVELEGAHLRALRTALTRHPELAPATLVRINPSLTETDGGLVFLDAADGLATMPMLPTVRSCLREVRAAPDPTLASLRDRLVGTPGFRGRDRTEAFVGKLVDAGLLEAYIPVSEHALDPVGALGRWVGRQRGENAARLARLIRRVADQQQRHVPAFDVDGSVARHAALRRAVHELRTELGADAYRVPASAKAVFHESAVLARPVATCSPEQWRPALDDLDVVRRFLSVFDAGLPVRLTLGRYFLERFGPTARPAFMEFYQAVRTELARPAETVTSAIADDLRAVFSPRGLSGAPELLVARDLEEIHVLGKLRAQARQFVLGSPRRDGVVQADPAEMAKLMDGWPAWLAPPASLACNVQLAGPVGEDGVRLVLNSVHVGHGRGVTRLAHILARVGAHDPTAEPRGRGDVRTGPDASVTAELGGLMGSTLNMRVPSAPYELDQPCAVSDRADRRRIPLNDLTVGHDPRTGLVHLRAEGLGTRVVPLHAGMMPESALPAAARFLLRACGPGYALHSGAPALVSPEDRLWADGPDPDRGAIRYPRLECGRVVVRRARWSLPAADVPRRARGEGEADHLLRVAAWARAEGLPRRVFVRGWGSGGAGSRRTGPPTGRAGERKPVHLDFANPWLVALFERQVGEHGRITVEEALPDPYENLGADPAHAHVAEFLVELTGVDDADGGPAAGNAAPYRANLRIR